MEKIWEEAEVSIENLKSHIEDCGMTTRPVDPNYIDLRTASGIGYRITILEDKKFIRIVTFLPLDRTRNRRQKLNFTHHLNKEIFLPTFVLDDDDDLVLFYVMPYTDRLIIDQFVSIVRRFGSLLDYIVDTRNDGGIIDFGNEPDSGNTNADATSADVSSAPPAGTRLH